MIYFKMEKNPDVIIVDTQGNFATNAKPKSKVKCVYVGFLYFHKFGLNINTYYIYNDTILKIGQGIFYSWHPNVLLTRNKVLLYAKKKNPFKAQRDQDKYSITFINI